MLTGIASGERDAEDTRMRRVRGQRDEHSCLKTEGEPHLEHGWEWSFTQERGRCHWEGKAGESPRLSTFRNHAPCVPAWWERVHA